MFLLSKNNSNTSQGKAHAYTTHTNPVFYPIKALLVNAVHHALCTVILICVISVCIYVGIRNGEVTSHGRMYTYIMNMSVSSRYCSNTNMFTYSMLVYRYQYILLVVIGKMLYLSCNCYTRMNTACIRSSYQE